MKRIIFSFLVCISQCFFLYGQDWLIDGSGYVSTIVKTPDGMGIMMTNGLISREFRISPGLSTINISNLMTGDSMLRTACSEGTLTIDGKDYPLGGLSGVEERGYMLPEWIDGMRPLENSFRVVDWTVTDLKPRMEWNRKRWALVKEWNPTGKELTITLEGPGDLKGVKVEEKPTTLPTDELLTFLSTKVVDIHELSVRAKNIMIYACDRNYNATIADVCRFSKTDLLKERNCGRKSLQEIVDYLDKHNASLGMDVEEIIKKRQEYLLNEEQSYDEIKERKEK